ncbi:hypothetical protein, partial [Escherichia coli]|uniref:hypothetical protein n=1 Tax=Escherichia coli TaxID=562 RepID=UPI001BE94610
VLFRTSQSSFDQLKLNPFFSACLNRQNSSPPVRTAITCHIAKCSQFASVTIIKKRNIPELPHLAQSLPLLY